MADISPANAAPARDLDAALATPEPAPRRRRPSLVWLMPLLAVLVAMWVVYQNYRDQGPLVTVVFPSASGIQAGTTELRIRDIRVGVVEEVGFTDGMAAVETQIRVDNAIAQYIDADAQFWLVQPQVSARGVTGIGTILSGVYIEASWDGDVGAPATEFVALKNPPLAGFGEEGTRIVLRTRAGGQLAAGAPVLATGIEVGRIGQPVLSETGNTVTMEAFIAAPYDRRLTTNSRFWDASGLSVNVGTGGLDLRVDSLAALVEGGVNFGTPVTGGEPVEDGHVFEVFPSETAAREDAFEGTTDPDLPLSIVLDTDVGGLGVGTLVRFRGVKAGEVVDVVGVAPAEGSDARVRLLIDMELTPTRIGLRPGLSRQQLRDVLAARVARGLRMRPATEGLFGQTTVIELANVEDAAPAELAEGPDGRLIFPTSGAVQAEGDSGVESLVARVQRLPIEEVMTSASDAMTSISRLAGAAEGVLTSDGVSRLPGTIDGTLAEVQGLVADVRQGGAIENVNSTLRSVEGTMASVNEAAQSLPEIVQELSGTAQDTLANVSQLAGTANGVLASDGVSRLPATVDATLAEVQGLVSEFREGGAIESVNATLRSAQGTLASIDEAVGTLPGTVETLSATAVDALTNVAGLTRAVQTTLGNVDAVTADLPETVDRLAGAAEGAIASANDALGNVSALADTANGVLSSEAVARLPESIDQTLGTARALVADLREGGVIENVNATLRTAETTLASVNRTVQGLPETVDSVGTAATDTLANVSALAAAAEEVLRSEGLDRLPATLEGTLAELRSLVGDVREGGAVANVNAAIASAERALASAETTLASVDEAARALPGQIERLTTGANAALENVGTLAGTANGVLGAEGVDELPATINGTLRELQAVAASLREGGAVESLNATLESARTTLASIDEAAGSLPEVVENLNTSANAALASVSSLAGTAKGVLEADGVDRLPATLEGTLAELRALSTEIREGGAIESLNATLRSAEAALFSVDNAAQSLPALVDRLNATADGLQGVVSGYAPNSRVYEDLRGVLREVSSTAEAFRSLARTIERRPNSLITGR